MNTWGKVRNVDTVDNYVDNLIIASLNAGKREITGVIAIREAMLAIGMVLVVIDNKSHRFLSQFMNELAIGELVKMACFLGF